MENIPYYIGCNSKSGYFMYKIEKIADGKIIIEPYESIGNSQLQLITINPKGNFIAYTTTEIKTTIVLIEIKNIQINPKSFITSTTISKLSFSPAGTYLIASCSNTNGTSTYIIWNPETGEKIGDFIYNNTIKSNPVSITWLSDDSILFKPKPTGIQCYEISSLINTESNKTFPFSKPVEISTALINDTKKFHLAVFSPTPSLLNIFSSDNIETPIITKGLPITEYCIFRWSHDGTHLLVWIHCSVDKSHQSYYGSSILYWIDIEDNKVERLFQDELYTGTIHDVSWSPCDCKFAVCIGLPADILLFNGKTGRAEYSLGKGKRNSIIWSNSGNRFLVGGFGSMAGDVDIWSNTPSLLGETRMNDATYCSWSPDGYFILVCTTTPRLRVKNGFSIYRYNGELLGTIEFTTLFESKWIPMNKNSIRSESPLRETLKKVNKTDVYVPRRSAGMVNSRISETTGPKVVKLTGEEKPYGTNFPKIESYQRKVVGLPENLIPTNKSKSRHRRKKPKD